jgi:5-methylcytosine-specific restriction endonuclease McrA
MDLKPRPRNNLARIGKEVTKRKRDNLTILFNIQGGKCCYCNDDCLLSPPPNDLIGKRHPLYMATLEHIYPKIENNPNREILEYQRMACKHCNLMIDDMPSKNKFRFFNKIKRPIYITDALNVKKISLHENH